ncbi:hypothetical protein BRADI_1g72170v3 [Brachypodium distachyon]|uniref:Uncharacterized protein n=1 Tax=Brachypodium distachyon TaxID=15368 RepID=I1H8V4_BRADI|nr:hypothetical protein BRADI_1g72170v3 [Brachypodium distachyon]
MSRLSRTYCMQAFRSYRGAHKAGAGFTERYQEDTDVGTSSLPLLSDHAEGFELPNWQLHSYPQPEQAFQFIESDGDAANTFVGSHNSFTIAPNEYSLDCNVGVEEASVAHDLPVCQNNNEMHGSLVDNPLAFAGDDPSLQIFLPSQPSSVPLQDEPSLNVSNGVQTHDWISLTLAAGGGGNEESALANGLNPQQHIQSKETEGEPLIIILLRCPILFGLHAKRFLFGLHAKR